jgi:hypothetical protein
LFYAQHDAQGCRVSRETSARAFPFVVFLRGACAAAAAAFAAAPQRGRGAAVRFGLAHVTRQGAAAPPLLRRSGQNGRVANRCQRQAYSRYSRVLTGTHGTHGYSRNGFPSGAQPVSQSTAGPSGSVRLQVEYSQHSRSLALGGLPSAGAGPSRARRGMSHGQYS